MNIISIPLWVYGERERERERERAELHTEKYNSLFIYHNKIQLNISPPLHNKIQELLCRIVTFFSVFELSKKFKELIWQDQNKNKRIMKLYFVIDILTFVIKKEIYRNQ